VDLKNMVFKHNFSEVVDVQFKCQVPGCLRTYTIKIFPKQNIYPKFCEEHRNDFRRENFETEKAQMAV
jgi:hypothetical protein